MAILGAVLAYLGRFVGRVVNMIFGWATTALFGQLPDSRSQTLLSVIALAAVVWLAAALGVLFPAFGVFLLGFVVLPEGVDRGWLRLAMLATAVVVPALVGVLSIFLFAPDKRPRGADRLKAVALGYPYTVGLALTLVIMTIFVPVLKLRNLARGWADEHIPVQVRPDGYDSVVQDVRHSLDGAGFPVIVTEPPLLVRLPHKLLGLFTRGGFGNLLANQLTLLKGEQVEVLLHSSDLVLSCGKNEKARARAALARDLAFTQAFLSWTADGQKLEERLVECWNVQKDERQDAASLDRALTEVQAVRRDLQPADLPSEEWEVLYRLSLQVEAALLRAAAPRAHGAPPGEIQEAVAQPARTFNPAA